MYQVITEEIKAHRLGSTVSLCMELWHPSQVGTGWPQATASTVTPHISPPVSAPFPQFSSLSGSQGIHETSDGQHPCTNQTSLNFTRAFKSPWAKGPTLTPLDLPALSEVECKMLANVMGLLRTEKQSSYQT